MSDRGSNTGLIVGVLAALGCFGLVGVLAIIVLMGAGSAAYTLSAREAEVSASEERARAAAEYERAEAEERARAAAEAERAANEARERARRAAEEAERRMREMEEERGPGDGHRTGRERRERQTPRSGSGDPLAGLDGL